MLLLCITTLDALIRSHSNVIIHTVYHNVTWIQIWYNYVLFSAMISFGVEISLPRNLEWWYCTPCNLNTTPQSRPVHHLNNCITTTDNGHNITPMLIITELHCVCPQGATMKTMYQGWHPVISVYSKPQYPVINTMIMMTAIYNL